MDEEYKIQKIAGEKEFPVNQEHTEAYIEENKELFDIIKDFNTKMRERNVGFILGISPNNGAKVSFIYHHFKDLIDLDKKQKDECLINTLFATLKDLTRLLSKDLSFSIFQYRKETHSCYPLVTFNDGKMYYPNPDKE